MKNQTDQIGAYPKFVSGSEAERIRSFQEELQRLRLHAVSFSQSRVMATYREAAAKYRDNPSDENFSQLKATALETFYAAQDLRVASEARRAERKFLQTQVVPFLRGLVRRGLDEAAKTAAEIREVEDKRSLGLIGKVPQKSEIAEAAMVPVRTFEGFLQVLESDSDTGSVVQMLLEHCQNGAVSSKE